MNVGRRRARREALFLLYQADLMRVGKQNVLERVEDPAVTIDPYTRHLVTMVLSMQDFLDASLDQHLTGWVVARLAPLERNILRIAAYELRPDSDVPMSVAIDEAVGLAKRYCSNEAGSLVNGVLAALAGDMQTADDGNGTRS
ncbi:MAG: transcription antitermination factor NusB [Actinobacteria bacterium]|nr:transcription antitermination factor NusB [Actinomycetota bacterium]